MRILLDECLPHELVDELVGHEVRTVQEQGWSGVENGELLRRAAGSFAAFLTVDKYIERTQKLPGNLAVVTIRGGRTASSRCGRCFPKFSRCWRQEAQQLTLFGYRRNKLVRSEKPVVELANHDGAAPL